VVANNMTIFPEFLATNNPIAIPTLGLYVYVDISIIVSSLR